MVLLSVALLVRARAPRLGAPLLALMLAATGLSTPAAAQAAAPGFVPADCKATAATPRAELETRRDGIQARLSKLRADLRAAAGDEPKVRSINRNIRRGQEDLLEVLFAIDCKKDSEPVIAKRAVRMERALPKAAPPPAPPTPAPSPPPAAARGVPQDAPPPAAAAPGAPAQPEALLVTTYYATNRKLEKSPRSPGETYGLEAISDLTFGRAVVSIPPGHTVGTIELPSIWKLERTADPSKHFVLKEVVPIESKAAMSEMSSRLRGGKSRAMLVYVHGYYMTFEEAALRTAQLAHDLQFPGIPFFYTWPSAGRVRAYLQDEETARLCESVFEGLLKQLSALPVEAIYIVAHSMGNRIVGHGLQGFVEKGNDTRHIKELLLAAPDINADIFKRNIAPSLAKMQNTRKTIYASSGDIALVASKVVHGFPRVGESSGGVQVYKGMDTIDASEASTITRNFGHSYLVDSTSVLKDLQTIIARQLGAKARGLAERGVAPDVYWQLR
ncbi:MAG: alpha/beta hydrolase [Hyphomicrobiaceae bacterium]|nr:alpha/beta hydrolase [Hyphomicrobiaceae bacterium]